ncbi:MAG: hypothetical protein ISS25_04905 [Nanoarchaeota archaeon]|nr:hypothetical protein [DPANN group archaeon]MBL7117140.1 hypothetical protein [Nanoarchaeota archaeon]
MSKLEIIEKTPINIIELKQKLKSIKKRDGELTFRGKKTEEYLNDFARLPKKSADELIGKLRKLKITRLKEEFIQKIVDLMPTSAAELKVVLQGYTLSVSNEDMKKIIKVVKDYTK